MNIYATCAWTLLVLYIFSPAALSGSTVDDVVASIDFLGVAEPDFLGRIGMEPASTVVIGEDREHRFEYSYGILHAYVGASGVISANWEIAVDKQNLEQLAKIWTGVAQALAERKWQPFDSGVRVDNTVIDGVFASSLVESLAVRKMWRQSSISAVEMRMVIPLLDRPVDRPYLYIQIGPFPYIVN